MFFFFYGNEFARDTNLIIHETEMFEGTQARSIIFERENLASKNRFYTTSGDVSEGEARIRPVLFRFSPFLF